MSQVYTGTVRVRHDELDLFGWARSATYLRHLAQVAVEASAAAGFDAAWYAAAGTCWIVRRSTLEVLRPVTDGVPLAVRTWVEEFRRVRSLRRYEMSDPAGRTCVDALTDWVYLDLVTARPRRAPQEMERRLGVAAGVTALRSPFAVPPPPAGAPRTLARAGYADVDPLGHMNNAAYLDLLAQSLFDVLAERDWPLDRLRAAGAVPLVAHADVEYLESAVYGAELETRTWFGSGERLAVHQTISRRGDERPLVQATTGWRWVDPRTGVPVGAPEGLAGALAELVVA